MSQETALYRALVADIKGRVRAAQNRAAQSLNAELVLLYWDVGRLIAAPQEHEGWGAAVIPRLAVGLQHELPEEKGFSKRNLKRMLRFFREYPDLSPKVPQAAALLEGPSETPREIVPQAAAHWCPTCIGGWMPPRESPTQRSRDGTYWTNSRSPNGSVGDPFSALSLSLSHSPVSGFKGQGRVSATGEAWYHCKRIAQPGARYVELWV